MNKVLGQLARHARVEPGRPAVCSGRAVIDYRMLTEAVREQAIAIMRLRLAPGEILAVQLPDGPDAVVALLAALEAKAPFVWLDPAYPPDRREHVVRDCRPAALLTEQGARRVRSAPGAVPGDTACVVHTSGSTGTPKGIVQRRANLDQFTPCFAAELALAPGARLMQWARMTYDAAHAEILAAMYAGATLVVPCAQEKSEPARIAALAAEHRVSHLLTVPSLCAAFLAARRGVSLPEVALLGLFGEQLPIPLLTEAGALLPGAEIVNFYGPTECMLATSYRVPRDFAGDTVPIGRPLPGRQVLVDPSGEIVVRTRYLAHGYLNRPDETARSFLPDPGGDRRVRCYRTGDLGRHTPDGELVFAGRTDDQVKIRGVRVQLGEIEAVLRAAPDVADAAVRVLDAGSVAPRIVAYVSPRPDLVSLRRTLTRTLPPVMVPAQYVVLEALPRTATGKLDRSALPEPPAVPDPRGSSPSGPVEDELARIWRAAIGCPTVGVDDDFFTVGGYSLLAPDIVTAVRARLGLTVPLRAVFEHSRFGDFAAYLTTLRPHDPLTKEHG